VSRPSRRRSSAAAEREHGQAGHQVSEDGASHLVEEVVSDLLGLGTGGPHLGDMARPVLLAPVGAAKGRQGVEKLEDGVRVGAGLRSAGRGVITTPARWATILSSSSVHHSSSQSEIEGGR
jgi:hypothetical protein